MCVLSYFYDYIFNPLSFIKNIVSIILSRLVKPHDRSTAHVLERIMSVDLIMPVSIPAGAELLLQL